MSGYDPMKEVGDVLDEATAPNRSIAIAPPPRRAIEHHAEPAAAPVVEVATEQPTEVAVTAVPEPEPETRRGRRTTGGETRSVSTVGAAGRTTTGMIPASIAERIQRLRLDADVEGRSFNLTAFFAAAIEGLPTDAVGLQRDLERYQAQINIDRRFGDDGWLPETRLAVRIGPDQERTIALAIRNLYERTGRRHHKQDLWTLALLRHLATHRR